MRNFLTIASGIDTLPVLSALARNPDLWDAHPIRTTHPGSAHAAASDILVMYGAIEGEPDLIVNDCEVRPFEAWARLPQLRPLVLGLMAQVSAIRLGRVVITRLPPGAAITPHADGGRPAETFDRYQIMLQCLPGVQFHCGDEMLAAKTGDAFQFQNREVHSVTNFSADDRIALIIDARSA